MNLIRSTALACFAMIGATLPAKAAFQLVYVVIGVSDNGGTDLDGKATVFHCTNLFNAPANARVQVRREDGTVAGATKTQTIPAFGSAYFYTKNSVYFFNAPGGDLNTGPVAFGQGRILSETPNSIVCSAEYVNNVSGDNFSSPRRMIRFPRGTSGGED